MRRSVLRSVVLATAAALAVGLAGCASAGSSGTATGSATVDDSAYVTPGKFTVATGDPAYEPYVIDNDPTTGQGFEAAVAYAVADRLGFSKDDVVWTRTTFDAAIAPGPKDFDVNIQQYSITDDRKQAVDFSSPYYQAGQAVVAIKGGAADGVTDIAGLKTLVLGALAGSTSAQTIDAAIAPTVTPQLYNSNEDAVAALTAGQIDAVVLDVPTAYIATTVYIENSFIVGGLPVSGVPDEWGMVLAKDSPLTARVSDAVDAIRADGTLAKLTDQWMGAGLGVTMLK